VVHWARQAIDNGTADCRRCGMHSVPFRQGHTIEQDKSIVNACAIHKTFLQYLVITHTTSCAGVQTMLQLQTASHQSVPTSSTLLPCIEVLSMSFNGATMTALRVVSQSSHRINPSLPELVKISDIMEYNHEYNPYYLPSSRILYIAHGCKLDGFRLPALNDSPRLSFTLLDYIDQL
jgi:hypothetical protein